MKNLIIHPEDNSTTFLKPIYKQASNQNVIERDANPEQIAEAIGRSDRIMMMGHGSPAGLFSVRMFSGVGRGRWSWLAIGKNETELLKASDQNIYIWCNANKFVEAHDLKGFYSGMFISEVGEARFCGVNEATQEMVNESNDTFSAIVGKYINLHVAELYENVMEEYGELAKTNPVARYNHQRLYLR